MPVFLLCCYALACDETAHAPTLRVFRTEYLWRSDWLKPLRVIGSSGPSMGCLGTAAHRATSRTATLRDYISTGHVTSTAAHKAASSATT